MSTTTRAGLSCVVTWNGRRRSRPITQVRTPSKSPVRRTCWMRVASAASSGVGGAGEGAGLGAGLGRGGLGGDGRGAAGGGRGGGGPAVAAGGQPGGDQHGGDHAPGGGEDVVSSSHELEGTPGRGSGCGNRLRPRRAEPVCLRGGR